MMMNLVSKDITRPKMALPSASIIIGFIDRYADNVYNGTINMIMKINFQSFNSFNKV